MGCVLREIDEKLPEGTDPDYENTTPTEMPYLNGVRTGSGAWLVRKSVYWAVFQCRLVSACVAHVEPLVAITATFAGYIRDSAPSPASA